MYKLTIVAGPNRGSSYVLRDGENSIGRLSGNAVTLSSGKVSKRHCVLVVSNGEIVVQDQNSSNGTFVNGVLSKSKKVRAGDRISVGDFVLEVSDPAARALQVAPAVGGFGNNVVQFPTNMNAMSPSKIAVTAPEDAASSSGQGALAAPADLKGKLMWFFDHNIMPIFYGLNFRHEWRILCVALFGVFTLVNLYFSVSPLLESHRAALVKEAGKRATFMAREIAEKNAAFMASNMEMKTEIGNAIENADGVRLAVLTDLDNRVIAPSAKLNSYLHSGPEAILATKAHELFRNGRETGIVSAVDSDTVVGIEPVRALNAAKAQNVVIGMAIVSVDTSILTPGLGEEGVIYAQTLIFTALAGGIILLIMYRMTTKPYEVLSGDLERALKGDLSQVTHEFKVEETNPLWTLINSALQRIPRSSESTGIGMEQEVPTVDELLPPLRQLGAIAPYGVVVLDFYRKIAFMNSQFEELSGIRADGALGQDMGSVAREQSLGIFVNDLLDRAQTNPEGVSEDYEFSGITFKVHVAAFVSPSSTQGPRGYLLTMVRGDS